MSTYKSKVTASNRASAEALYTPIDGLVPIAKRLRALAVCGVLADRADEHVADRRRRNQASGPDLPVCNGWTDTVSRYEDEPLSEEIGLPDFVYVWL